MPVVVPSAGAAWDVGADDVDGAAVDAGLLNRLEVVPELAAAPEADGAELPPPRLGNDDEPDPPPSVGNSDEPDAVVVVPPPLVAVVVAPPAAPVLAGVDVGGLAQLKVVPPPEEGAVLDPAPAKRLLDGAAEDAGAAMFPPKLKDGAAPAVGCDEVGCAADEVPRLNPPRGLLAGVEEGVVLPRPPKSGFGGFCAPCVLDVAAWFPPPKRPEVGVDAAGALLFASVEPSVFPRLNLGGSLPRGFAAEDPEAAAMNGLAEVDEDVGVGFAPPNNDDPACAVPLGWLFCWPNKEEPVWALPLA